MKQTKKFKKISILLVAIMVVALNLDFLSKVFAGTLTKSSVVELGTSTSCTGTPASPMIAGQPQCLAIEFTPASSYTPSAGGAGQVQLTFNSWTGGSAAVNATQSAGTNGCTTLFPSTPTTLPGSLTATGSGSVITIAGATALIGGTTYCTELTNASSVTNPPAGSYTVTISTGTDSQTDAIDVLSAGGNAYSITATVNPTFTMSIADAAGSTCTSSPVTDCFSAALTSASVSTSQGVTTTINTNAASGWFVWVKDSNAGLTSTQASTTIATVPADTNETMNSGSYGPGNAKYGLGAVTGTNSPTIEAAYAYGGGTTGGGLAINTYYELATRGVPSAGDTFTTHELANISATTPPATDYTDIITEIGAGSF